MSDYITGLTVFVCAMVAVFFAFNYVSRATVYSDQWKSHEVNLCIEKGYSYGECYNIIYTREHYKFSH